MTKKAPNPFPSSGIGESDSLTPPPTSSFPASPGLMPPASQTEDANGFHNFVHNTKFLDNINHPDFPHRGAGIHVPVWLSPALAKDVLIKHGGSGHAIPHPNIDLKNLHK